MARLIDAENYRNLFNEEFKKTMELIRKGETHLDTLAEGFTEADRVIRALPTIDPVTAAAEALGMSPDRLRELAQAEKEGRLVVLPAEKIFELTWDAGPNCDLICPVSINGVGQCDFCENGKLYIYERTCRQEHIEHVGKTVFLTREAAEAALDAMGGENNA